MHPGGRITITPAQLLAALATHPTIAAACRSLGITRQAIHAKHRDGRPQRPDLLAVLERHKTIPRDENGHARTYTLHVDADTLARLDANGERLRSAAARAMVREALLRGLPEPQPPGPLPVRLDLGPTWRAVGVRIGSFYAEDIAAVVRGILAAKKKC